MSARLLIVDDHASTRELIRKFLSAPGMTFQECASGEEAVACVEEFKPDWVTMDVQLPGLNGFDSTRAIKKKYPGTRVLIVTAFNEPHFHDLARSAGAVGFILKENILALRLMLENDVRTSFSSPAATRLDRTAP